MEVGSLSMYLIDLIKMGFVSEHIEGDGTKFYNLTEMGKKSGLILKNDGLG